MKKSELKKLIKECVEEILNEYIERDPLNFYYKLNRSTDVLDKRNAPIWQKFMETLTAVQKTENPKNPGIFGEEVIDKAVAEHLKKNPRVKANLDVLAVKFKEFVGKEQNKPAVA